MRIYIFIIIIMLLSPASAILRKFPDYTERWYQGYDDTTAGMTCEPTNNYFGINDITPECSLDVSGNIQANTVSANYLKLTTLREASGTEAASSANAGKLRYRVHNDTAYFEISMQYNETSYNWQVIESRSWSN